jgi:hypothetical protein
VSLLRTTPDEYLPQGTTQRIQYTGIAELDALLGRDRWASEEEGTLQISFSFVSDTSRFDASSAEAEFAVSLPLWVQDLVRESLALLERYIDVTFIEVLETPTQCGVIRFSGLSGGDEEFAAFAFMPSTGPWGGDVFIYADQINEKNRDYLDVTILHEIGHALGLKHPFEEESYNSRVLSDDLDQITMTLMSYTDVAGSEDAFLLDYPNSPMPLDILALQALYGASKLSLGDDIYDLSEHAFQGFFALFDAGGVDTVDASRLLRGVKLSLNPNVWSDVGVEVRVSDGTYFSDTFILVQTSVEHVIGSDFDDLVEMNDQSNVVRFGDGFDIAVWGESISRFSIDYLSGDWIVKDRFLPLNEDHLVDVERLSFLDRTIEVEAGSHNGFSDIPVDLYQFFIVAFSAAPGLTYLSQLAEAYRFGMSVRDIVNIFVSKPQFTDVYPIELSEADFSKRLVANVVKGSASDLSKAQAVIDLHAAFEFGFSRGDVIYTVFGNLAKMPIDDPTWGGTAALLGHQLEVARYYSEVMNQSTTDLTTLRAVLTNVTSESFLNTEEDLIALVVAGLTSSVTTPLSQASNAHESQVEVFSPVPLFDHNWIDPVPLY